MVLRFNRAVVRKHEEDVGQFWTHWCCTFRDRQYPGVKGHFIQEYLCCDSDEEIEASSKQKNARPANINYMPNDYLYELFARYIGVAKGRQKPTFYKPSTGLRLLWWVYKETGKINKERLFGFDCFCDPGKDPRKSEHETRCRKYYNQGNPSPKHRPRVERAIYNEITS